MKSNIKLAIKLADAEIKDIASRYEDSLISLKTYAVRRIVYHKDSFAVQPQFDDTFYCADKFFAIAHACGCSTYITMMENESEVKTPTIVFC